MADKLNGSKISRRTILRADLESELCLPVKVNGFTADFFHVLNDVVCPAISNSLPLMAGAHGDDNRARCNTCTDAGRRVFDDNTTLRVEAEAFGCKQEGVGGRLASLEAFVVRGDGYLGRCDADARHAAIR